MNLYGYRYQVPKEISQHTSHIFNTVQLPPIIVNHKAVQTTKNKNKKTNIKKNTNINMNINMNTNMRRMRRASSVTSHDTNISFLRSLYKIPNRQGSMHLTQSLFETNEEYYSPKDLEMFQEEHSLTIQAAIPIGGYTTETCSLQQGVGNTCFEANLDIQYMMGISQLTLTKGKHIRTHLNFFCCTYSNHFFLPYMQSSYVFWTFFVYSSVSIS